MDWLLRRNFWIVNLIFLALLAFILAQITNAILVSKLAKSIEINQKPIGAKPAEVKLEIRNFELANERNLFGAKREKIVISDTLDEEEDYKVSDWREAQASRSGLRLIGTAVFEDPRFSTATIVEDSKDSFLAKTYSINECESSYVNSEITAIMGAMATSTPIPCNNVTNNLTLVRIETYKVYLFNETERRYEFLLLDRDGEILKPVAAEKKIEAAEGVKKTGGNSFEIEQAELDKTLGNLAEISTQARVFPAFENGKSIGFKIVNIKDNSVFDKIGLKNGDIIMRVNGYEINSPDKALELFNKLKTTKQFNVDIKRNEKNMSFDYNVVQ